MGILRSEQMRHGTLVLPVESAKAYADLIGSNANMQFEDMNANCMSRPYKKYCQRIDEMERIIRFLTDELARVPGAEITTTNVHDFLLHQADYKLEDVESRLLHIYKHFTQFKDNSARLVEKRNAAVEERHVVQTATASLRQSSSRPRVQGAEDDEDFSVSQPLLGNDDGNRSAQTTFSNIAGVIPQADQDRFARALFRATRGNTFTHFEPISETLQDPKTGREVIKSAFVIYFQDVGSGSAMGERIQKMCSSFGVNIYAWPTSHEAAQQRLVALASQVEDQDKMLLAHESFVKTEAAVLVAPAREGADSVIEEWRLFCIKEKSLYMTLNLFEGHMNLRANCWYPAEEEDQIRAMLIQQGRGNSSAMLVSDRGHSRKLPPTYIKKNEFTGCFQELIDTYGLPKYQEANPMLFTIVTFPFLFGVMYGDVGHGLLLFLTGLWLVWNAESIKHSVPAAYNARYIVTMMGFFGIYAGFMYNDFFSVGFNLFGSRWTPIHEEGQAVENFRPAYDALNSGAPGSRGPYPWGLDPAWHGSTNELLFLNSLKMKISVIVGVVQMIAGLLLRFSNAFNERSGVDFFCECIPMMIFMICFFGYMDYMILYKWVTPMDNPPSIINSLICMAMNQHDVMPMFNPNVPKMLMVISILTVPWLLIPKPMILLMRHKSEQNQANQSGGQTGGQAGGQAGQGGHGHGDEEGGKKMIVQEEEAFDFGEIFIHQTIETIEYVLGTVSHTASYLRLWALSLAHQQLSLVFFQKTILSGMTIGFPANVIVLYVLFAAWFGITLAVLMGMDVLECFLHTLRLHWVEFQSKFYKADGYKFEPYRHQALLEKRED